VQPSPGPWSTPSQRGEVAAAVDLGEHLLSGRLVLGIEEYVRRLDGGLLLELRLVGLVVLCDLLIGERLVTNELLHQPLGCKLIAQLLLEVLQREVGVCERGVEVILGGKARLEIGDLCVDLLVGDGDAALLGSLADEHVVDHVVQQLTLEVDQARLARLTLEHLG
jgi:hypothetical protein